MIRISNNLRSTLRQDGYVKLAAVVMRNQNEAANHLGTLDGALQSIFSKMAANKENERVINEGLTALDALRGSK